MKESVSGYEMASAYGVGLYCGTYRKYASGSIYGMWIDLEKVGDADEFFEVCRKLHDDESDPEFMFQDFSGFPEELYHESMSKDDIQKILEYVELSDEDKEIVEAYCEVKGVGMQRFEDVIEDAKDKCVGQYDEFRDFTDEAADEEIACHSMGSRTEFFERFFDYDKYEREMKGDYVMSHSGYVFYCR